MGDLRTAQNHEAVGLLLGRTVAVFALSVGTHSKGAAVAMRGLPPGRYLDVQLSPEHRLLCAWCPVKMCLLPCAQCAKHGLRFSQTKFEMPSDLGCSCQLWSSHSLCPTVMSLVLFLMWPLQVYLTFAQSCNSSALTS